MRPRCTLVDAEKRGYAQVTNEDRVKYSLQRGHDWWWCVLAYGRPGPPRLGGKVHHRIICKIALGFERGRPVGVVGLR